MDCNIIGDSIAVGVSQFLPQCSRDAAIGRRAESQVSVRTNSELTLISLGSNNTNDIENELIRIRESITGRVFWLIPNLPISSRATVIQLAYDYGDMIIDVRRYVGSDGIHPTGGGYRQMALQIRNSY